MNIALSIFTTVMSIACVLLAVRTRRNVLAAEAAMREMREAEIRKVGRIIEAEWRRLVAAEPSVRLREADGQCVVRSDKVDAFEMGVRFVDGQYGVALIMVNAAVEMSTADLRKAVADHFHALMVEWSEGVLREDSEQP